MQTNCKGYQKMTQVGKELTLYLLVLCGDIFYKQFGTRSGRSGSKLFDTLMVFLKEFFEKVDFEKKKQEMTKNMKNLPACKEFKVI